MGPLAAADVSIPSATPVVDGSADLLAAALAELKGGAVTPAPALVPMANGGASEGKKLAAGVEEQEQEEEEEEEEVAKYEIPQDPETNVGMDARDANTPDKWIPRHPELIRLTGKHPFNCEPPLDTLIDHGFITPVSLHYVRNHGYVPQGDWDSWRIHVGGKVKRPTSFSMADLLSLPSRTLPVLLVCVGNRRKEQNMVKKTRGFNWGGAGLSNTVWKGVLLRDVLQHCGILPAGKGAQYVCFEGKETLPGKAGSDGCTYGTSITRARAMDPAMDVMLAYEQNGDRLRPDHGFPVRLIIPGYIGGRMVKWLQKIEVTETESSSHYHFFDNRVLPPSVTPERADAEGWWYKPEYICNELSINSAISHPAHNEQLLLTPPAGADTSTGALSYLLKGYGYSGGGRKVTRVEVTLDDGATWRLAELVHEEKPTQYGKWWCWCHWSLRVSVADLMAAPSREMAVRAWDEATNTQPQQLTWNVLGMMNNCWFRIKIHPVMTAQGLALRFEHPTVAGAPAGGWMDKEASFAVVGDAVPGKSSAPDAVAAAAVPGAVAKAAPVAVQESAVVKSKAPTSGLRQIPMSEVEKHDTAESPWIVVDGKVYDCTRFLKDHPGGAESILINAGTDSTEEFDAIHSKKAKGMLAEYLIGEVAAEGATAVEENQVVPVPAAVPVALALAERPVALNPKQRLAFKLVQKDVLSRDVRRFRFALQTPEHRLGLPVGKHILVSAKIDGALVMRAYTPSSSDDEVGYFELVIKVYFKNEVPQFPNGGVFSQHLESLQLGDTVDVKGPIGHIHYKGNGVFTSDGETHTVKRIAMMAGGTGITPMYQVIKAILKDPEDSTEMWLIYANRSESDILLREDLDSWAKEHSSRFHVWYTIETPGPPDWAFSTGRVCKEMFEAHLPAAGEDTVAFMCGPPPMLKFGCIPNLEAVGYKSSQLFSF